MIELDWEPDSDGHLVARVAAISPGMTKPGYFEFCAVLRPPHCDRGTYLVHIDNVGGVHPVDAADLWPRFYFDMGAMMSEVRAWVNKRDSCLAAARSR